MNFKNILFFLIYFVLKNTLIASPIESKYCAPYFVSTKSQKVNLHVGPGYNYKISWVYVSRFVPFLVIAKYDHWRKIRDPEGIEGWIHKNMLTSKRFAISIKDVCDLHKDPKKESLIIAKVKKNVIMKLKNIKGDWCEVDIKFSDRRYFGWINKKSIFGTLKNETW